MGFMKFIVKIGISLLIFCVVATLFIVNVVNAEAIIQTNNGLTTEQFLRGECYKIENNETLLNMSDYERTSNQNYLISMCEKRNDMKKPLVLKTNETEVFYYEDKYLESRFGDITRFIFDYGIFIIAIILGIILFML